MSKLSESVESLPKRSLKSKSLINDTLADGMISINDDEAERREVEDQRRQQEIDESATKSTKKRRSIFQLIAEYQQLSPSERAAHYQKCLQMSTENKINTQNAFSLLLIDQMAQMMKEKSQMDNFQIAGCTLDASSKIYACRVDVVHSEAMRIARGFEKHSKRKIINDDENNSDDGISGDKDDSHVKTKKVRKRNVLVDKNSQTLIAEPETDGYSIHQKDTIFEEMATSGDASEPGNCHFLTTLKVQDGLCKIMLQSELPFSPTSQDTETYFLPDKICSLCEDFPLLTDVFICPTLRNQSECDVSILESKTVEEGLTNLSSLEENDEVFEMNYDEPEQFDDEDNNENNNLLEKAPGLDQVQDDDEDSLDTIAPPTACRRMAEPETIVDVANTISVTSLDYSFFNQKAVNLLGGPGHWKIGSFFSTQSSRNPTKRKRKEAVVVNYSKDEGITCSNNTTLTNRTMQIWSPEKLLIPAVQHEVKDFFILWALPRAKLKQSGMTRREHDDDDENDMDVDGSIDMEFGDEISHHEEFSNAGQAFFGDYQSTGVADENEFSNVVAYRKETVANASTKVLSSNAMVAFLPYALRAKKVDMKQLKGAIFEILTDALQNKENATANQPCLKFSKLYNDLPHKLEQKMEENLTPHLAFMALLHLANEKTLFIQDQKDLSDLRITFECA